MKSSKDKLADAIEVADKIATSVSRKGRHTIRSRSSGTDKHPSLGLGGTVAQIRASPFFNVQPGSIALLNGHPVAEDYRLRDNDVLEFIMPNKGEEAMKAAMLDAATKIDDPLVSDWLKAITGPRSTFACSDDDATKKVN